MKWVISEDCNLYFSFEQENVGACDTAWSEIALRCNSDGPTVMAGLDPAIHEAHLLNEGRA